MDLTVEEVAELLHLSESTVTRLATESHLPSYRWQDHFRFNRLEIEQWMMQYHQAIFSEKPVSEKGQEMSGWQQFGLFRAIHRGGVSEDVGGDDKVSIIHRVMDHLAPLHNLDGEAITSLLLDRERLMPTSLAHGVAVPHTRDFLIRGPYDLVHLVYLQDPIDWGALDEEPVHTLFFLFACDDKRHLNLLAKIAHLVSQPQMVDLLRTRPAAPLLLEGLRVWETRLK